ncbi:hypothetical protein RB598_002193 [Gaeumannomyces tritici]
MGLPPNAKAEAVAGTAPTATASLDGLEVPGEPQPRDEFKPGLTFYGAFGSLLIVNLAAALDATSLSVALPIISKDLGGTAIEAFWSGTSFLLTNTVFQLTFASASHTFGRKALVMLSLLLFTTGSLVAALAPGFPALLAGRAVQGAGVGGIISLTEVVITDLVPLRERGKWFGLQGAVWAVGSVAGPPVGGALAQAGQWRWIFWLNLPVAGVGAVAVAFFLRLQPVPGALAHKLLRFDWAGVLLLTAGGTAFLMPVTWGDIVFPWSDWRSVVPLVVGAALVALFVWYEARWAARGGRQPLVRLRIFGRRTAAVCYFGTFVHGVVLWCMLYYMPLYYECVKGYTPAMAGVAIFPQTFTVAPTSILVGILVSRFGRFRWAVWLGWSLSVPGLAILYLLDADTTPPQWVFLNLVSGFGLGLLYTSLSYGTIGAADERDAGQAASMYVFSRSLGQCVGVSVGGAVFQNVFAARLSESGSGSGGLADRAAGLAREASALVEVVRGMDPASPERAVIVNAYADALKVVWVSMAGVAFLALLASLLMRHIDITRSLETEQGLQGKPAGREKPTASSDGA